MNFSIRQASEYISWKIHIAMLFSNAKLCSNGTIRCTQALPFTCQAINKYSTIQTFTTVQCNLSWIRACYRENNSLLFHSELHYSIPLIILNFNFYKYLHNYVDCDFASYFELVGSLYSLRSSNNGTLLKLPRVKTTALQVSYFYRLVRLWNSLPRHIREASSVFSYNHI